MGRADGKVVISTELDNNGLKRGINNISGGLGGLKSVVGKLGAAIAAAFAVQKVVQFGAESVKAARQLSDAMTGLQSIVEGQGRSFEKAQGFIQDYISDGLVPATNAVTAYKNLAMRGYDDSQIEQVMTALKNSAAFGRQSSLTMGEAVQSATEGLKNENSILVDNAGVTKNVSVMWKEYARSIGVGVESLTQQQKIQAEVNGIITETRFQANDAAKAASTFSGQLMQLSFNFNNLKVAIGNAIIPIAQKILPVINSIIAALTRLANTFASVVGAIFGKATMQSEAMTQQNAAVAASAGAGAEAENALADATKKAGKAANGASTGIDELNVLQQNTGAGTGAVQAPTSSGGIETGEQEETVPPLLAKIKEMLADLNALFAPSLATWGKAFQDLKKPIFDAFALAKTSALDLWNNALMPLGNYILTQFIPNVVNGFSETFAPIFADVLTSAVGQWALNFQQTCALVGDAVNTFIIPLVQLLDQVIADMFTGISKAWEEYGAPVLAAWEERQANLRTLLESLYYGVIQPVLQGIMAELTWLWDEHLKPLWDNLMLFFGAFAEMVLALWNERIYPMIQNFVTIFGPQIAGVVQYIVSSFSTAVAIIGDVINGVIQIMRGLCDFLTGVFTGNWQKAWGGIQRIFGGVWAAIEGVFKGVVNRIVDGINFLIRAVARAINSVVDAINSVGFDLPDWGFLGDLAGKSFHLDLPHMPEYQIPKLAQGAVLPANKPFLAMVGEQRRGTNVEAPLETIKQGVREELASILGQLGGTQEFTAEQPIEISLDGEVLYRAMERIRAGRGVQIGGAFANAY